MTIMPHEMYRPSKATLEDVDSLDITINQQNQDI